MYPGGRNYHRLFVISGYLIVEYFGFSTSDKESQFLIMSMELFRYCFKLLPSSFHSVEQDFNSLKSKELFNVV